MIDCYIFDPVVILAPIVYEAFVFGPFVYCVVFSVLSSCVIISLGKRADCFTLIGFLDVMWLLVFCYFYSQCRGLVCSV